MSVVRAAGIVIYRKIAGEIQYLLLQASYPPFHWTPPKGHVDPGEDDDMQTALRETQEEAGISNSQLNVTAFTKTLNYNVKGRPKAVVYWLAELIDSNTPVKLSDEHKDFAWLPLEEAGPRADYAGMKTLLTECQNFINNGPM